MNTPVSFETAKLLKEKGFGLTEYDYIQLPRWYDNEGEYFENEVYISKKFNNSPNHLGADTINDFEAELSFIDNSLNELYLAPTIAEVVMWLHEKHNIWIYVTIFQTDTQYYCQAWIQQLNKEDICVNTGKHSHTPSAFGSPTEAYSAAIEYTLENIK